MTYHEDEDGRREPQAKTKAEALEEQQELHDSDTWDLY